MRQLSTLDRFYPVNETSSGDPLYYSFIDALGSVYYILEYNVSSGTFRYYEGFDDGSGVGGLTHDTAWTARATNVYVRFDKLKLIK